MESVLKTAFPFVVISVAVVLAFQGVLMIVAYTVLGRAQGAWLDTGPDRAEPCRAVGRAAAVRRPVEVYF